jgi:hypothetical protein
VTISALTLVGCGQKDYPHAQACGVSSTLIAGVAGTKTFTVAESDTALPLDGDKPVDTPGGGSYVCRVDVDGKKAFAVTIDVETSYAIAAKTRSIKSAAHPFTDNGISGKAETTDGSSRDVSGLWVCGDIGGEVTGTAKKQPSTKALTDLLKAWAKAGGCWTAGAAAKD